MRLACFILKVRKHLLIIVTSVTLLTPGAQLEMDTCSKDDLSMDCTSGVSHSDLLIKYLETFVELSLKPHGMEEANKDREFAIKVTKHALKPLDIEMLYTGSVAEGVSATYMKPTVIGLPAVYAPECDIMAVVKIEDILQNGLKYKMRVWEDMPCFVSVVVLGNIEEAPQLMAVYKDNARVNSVFYYMYADNPYKLIGNILLEGKADQPVISPRFFLEYCEEIVKRTVASSWMIFEPINYGFQTRQHKVSIHGPAIKLQSDSFLNTGMVIYPKIEGLDEPPYSEEEERNINQNDLDIVPSIKLPDWPKHATEWITRKRLWPCKQVINDIVSHGVMIVCKTPPSGDADLHWRLSFSRAEITLLSTPELPCRQHAHKIFKYIVKHAIRPAKILNSYHCKTVMLWASERTEAISWSWDRLGYMVLGLLDDLIAAVRDKYLPHYFLPQVNLFESITDDLLFAVGNNLADFRRNPITRLPEFSTYNRDAALSRQETRDELETEQSEAIISLLEQLRGPYTKEPELYLPGKTSSSDEDQNTAASQEDPVSDGVN